jgi:carboxymethylenebutenolidase
MQTSTLTFPSGSHPLQAYLARPDGDGPFPALVLIHEAYGLNDDMRRIARKFAGEGYAALAVDLFAGRNRAVCMVRFFGGMFLNALNHSGIHDLKAALDHLAAQPFVDAARLGAVGFCMGGGFAVAWACTDPRLRVIAPFYGSANPPAEALARSCPVVGSWPEPDFSTAAGKRLDEALDRHNIPHNIRIYPGATHSFFNARANESPANTHAAEDSWQRVLRYFRDHGL